MRSAFPIVFAAASTLLAACAGSGENVSRESVGHDREAIIGGANSSLFPEVGIVGTADATAQMCSGTLIAPNIVLTAGHCVRSGAAYGFYTGAGATFTGQNVVESTLDALGNTTKHAVLESGLYPQVNLNASPFQNDVAYVRLAAPIFDIKPAAFGPLPAAGTNCTVVGFGMVSLTSPTGLYKKSGTVSVQSIGNTINVTRVDSAQYRGDSGGPMYCGGLQVGVFSWIDDLSSVTATRREARIDGAVATWIQTILAKYPVQAPDAGADAGAGADAATATPPESGDSGAAEASGSGKGASPAAGTGKATAPAPASSGADEPHVPSCAVHATGGEGLPAHGPLTVVALSALLGLAIARRGRTRACAP